MINTRLRYVLILAAASLIIAAACYFLGGIIAEAASASPIMGVTFKAGGALAGFFISFGALFFVYKNIEDTSLRFKVAVSLSAGTFSKNDNTFFATMTVMKPESGAKKDSDAEAIWEARNLTVHLRGLEQDDLVMIHMKDSKGGSWRSDFFSPLCPKITLE